MYLSFTGIDETVKIVQSLGGFCKGYKVDISNKDQVYKYADLVREEVGEVSAALISFRNKRGQAKAEEFSDKEKLQMELVRSVTQVQRSRKRNQYFASAITLHV